MVKDKLSRCNEEKTFILAKLDQISKYAVAWYDLIYDGQAGMGYADDLENMVETLEICMDEIRDHVETCRDIQLEGVEQ